MGFLACLIWLLCWLCNGTPDLEMWNIWAVSLTICVIWWFFG